jgi:hypothetical protein
MRGFERSCRRSTVRGRSTRHRVRYAISASGVRKCVRLSLRRLYAGDSKSTRARRQGQCPVVRGDEKLAGIRFSPEICGRQMNSIEGPERRGHWLRRSVQDGRRQFDHVKTFENTKDGFASDNRVLELKLPPDAQAIDRPKALNLQQAARYRGGDLTPLTELVGLIENHAQNDG